MARWVGPHGPFGRPLFLAEHVMEVDTRIEMTFVPDRVEIVSD